MFHLMLLIMLFMSISYIFVTGSYLHLNLDHLKDERIFIKILLRNCRIKIKSFFYLFINGGLGFVFGFLMWAFSEKNDIILSIIALEWLFLFTKIYFLSQKIFVNKIRVWIHIFSTFFRIFLLFILWIDELGVSENYHN